MQFTVIITIEWFSVECCKTQNQRNPSGLSQRTWTWTIQRTNEDSKFVYLIRSAGWMHKPVIELLVSIFTFDWMKKCICSRVILCQGKSKLFSTLKWEPLYLYLKFNSFTLLCRHHLRNYQVLNYYYVILYISHTGGKKQGSEKMTNKW